MVIKQFEDKNLAHFSYAIIDKGEIALIDPSRDPKQYYDLAKKEGSVITTIIETHPHADFISSHLEIHKKTGATIYVSKLAAAEYPHQTFDDGEAIILGDIVLKSLNTPGHSPDSISIVVINSEGIEIAVFTGDTLFIGDCGRPDLREKAGAITATRAELAKQMFHTLRNKLMTLPNDVLVYPAHGAGSLCGKGLSDQKTSTIGVEKSDNWSLKNISEDDFIKELLADQPFIPKYFTYDVELNKKGANSFEESINNIPKREPVTCQNCAKSLDHNIIVVDTRPQLSYKKSHLKNAINIPNDTKFETWLGSIIGPDEKFYLLAENDEVLTELTNRIAKIGYESNIELAFISDYGDSSMPVFDAEQLKNQEDAFTIVDIRNPSEVTIQKIFTNSINIPLYQLRERAKEIPLNKPIVVHCAGGYRSAAGSSILKYKLNGNATIFDLSEAVKQFQK